MRNFKSIFLAAILALSASIPAFAAPTSTTQNNLRVTGNLTVDGTSTHTGATTQTGNFTVGGNLAVTGTSTHTGAVTNSAAVTNSTTLTQTGVATFTAAPVLSSGTITANGDTNTIPDLGNASFVMTEGTQTINGAKTFGTAPTITGGLTAANIQTGSVKRVFQKCLLSPVTGAAADTTTYAGLIAFGRACTITRVTIVAHVAPTVGTDTVEVLKNGTTTVLNAATFDANTLVADVASNATLTATGADLALAATNTVRCKYNAGTQTVDAENVEVIVEAELTDF